MKKHRKVTLMTVVALLAVLGAAVGASAMMYRYSNQRSQAAGCAAFATAPLGTLTDEEKASLVYMAEEEKLAHDVYVELADTWKYNAFSQIANSELRHMGSISMLLARYGVADPTEGAKEGAFTNKDLKALYDRLVAEGKASLAAALKVGATIEDLDIADHDKALKTIKNEDVARVYENLKAGSMNHMNAFYTQLKAQGGDYKPQYIGADLFAQMIEGRAGFAANGQCGMMAGRTMRGGYGQGRGANCNNTGCVCR